MQLNFTKYQGAGNDFVLINGFADNAYLQLTRKKISGLCDRRFGIGADGLIILVPADNSDFEMIYYNADGRPGSMCGNGGRCTFRFANDLKLIGEKSDFIASDGPHTAFIDGDGSVSLKMKDVNYIETVDDNVFVLDTGSPHYVKIVDDLSGVDVFNDGKAIRYDERFKEEGINVNFIQLNEGGIEVATYERGVEDETFSCGTGVTASALVVMKMGMFRDKVNIKTKGGNLSVMAHKSSEADQFTEVWLTGPASYVFNGVVEI